MKFRVFQYSVPAPDDLADLNAFLGSNRIVAVAHQVVAKPRGATLIFVVEYLERGAPPSGAPTNGDRKGKVDYRDVLKPADFEVFSRLREERKVIAEAEGLPVYTVFTNAQLAEMVERRMVTAAALGKIDGLGDARLAKYGERVLRILCQAFDDGGTKGAAAS
jgi:superfamily II DNA helicase RecQ